MTYYALIESNDHGFKISYHFQKVFLALLIGSILLLTLIYTVFFYHHSPSVFLILLGSISLVLLFFQFLEVNTIKEICFDRHGLRRIYKTHPDLRSWVDLVGVNFNVDCLQFRYGGTVNLPGLRTLMPVIFRILDQDSDVYTALRTAWKAYLIGERQGYISLKPHDDPKKAPQPHSTIEMTPDQIQIEFNGKAMRDLFVISILFTFAASRPAWKWSSFTTAEFPSLFVGVIVIFLIGNFIRTPYGDFIDFLCQAIQITAHGLSRTSWFGKTRHWAWDSLSGINFQKGFLQFEDGSKIYLGRIGYDLSPIIDLVGADSRLAKAWEDYLSNPQPKRGLIRC